MSWKEAWSGENAADQEESTVQHGWALGTREGEGRGWRSSPGGPGCPGEGRGEREPLQELKQGSRMS